MSDSDSDSDYEPGKDEEEVVEESGSHKLSTIPAHRRHHTEELFADMQREEEAFLASIRGKKDSLGKVGLAPAKSKPTKEVLRMLSQVFGSNQAPKMTQISRNLKRPRGDDDNKVRDMALQAAKRVKKHVKVSETVKFAGQAISVQRTVLSESAPSAASVSSSQGLDKVIDEIKGPKTISTVTKSSMDWDTFKEKEGLEDDLATAAKGNSPYFARIILTLSVDGYLHRKDFLDRCDVRAFESERDHRLQNSLKNQ